LVFLQSYLFFQISKNKDQIIRQGVLAISLFFLNLYLICFIDANLRLIFCTACDDGRLTISPMSVAYNAIIDSYKFNHYSNTKCDKIY